LHAGGLAEHFDHNKMIEAFEYRFYWTNLKRDFAKIVGQYRACQLAKQQKQIGSPYTPSLYPVTLGKT